MRAEEGEPGNEARLRMRHRGWKRGVSVLRKMAEGPDPRENSLVASRPTHIREGTSGNY